jgi:parvulin-like peptidyl-prolyl isomerase
MKRVLFFTCILGILVLSMSCSKTEEKAVARMGDYIITVRMLKDAYLAISPANRPELRTIDDKEQFARDVLGKEILRVEAERIGFSEVPEVVGVRQNAIARRAWQDYYDDRVRARVEISDDDMRELYQSQRYMYHLSWIFLRSKSIADALLARIKAGEDFGKIASIYSMDPSREANGDLGFKTMGTMPANVDEVIRGMSPGEISEAIPYDYYYAIFMMHERQERDQQSFEASKAGLASMLRMLRETAVQRKMAEELKQKYDFGFNDDVVEFMAAKTRKIYTSEQIPPGQIPEFTDEEAKRIVARYEGKDWHIRDYMERVRGLREYMRPAHGADGESIKSVIGDFVTGELWQLEIESGGYKERPEVVRAAERAMEEALVTTMHENLIKDVKVDDEKVRAFYEEHEGEMYSEPGVRLAAIFSETEQEAQAVYGELQAGKDFARLAREKSTDKATAQRGGELIRPLYKRQLQQFPDLELVVDGLSENQFSSPMPVPPGFGISGYLVVKVLEKMEARQLEFDEIKDMLMQRVLQIEQDRVFSEWITAKMEEYSVEIYPDGLAEIDFLKLRMEGA